MSAKAEVAAFRHNAVDFVSDADLERKLALGRPLRIKYGCDPTAPNLHLGHAVGFEKLRQLRTHHVHTLRIAFALLGSAGGGGQQQDRGRSDCPRHPTRQIPGVSANSVTQR